MDKIGQPRKQGDRSSPLKEGKPPKAKRKVYTYCSTYASSLRASASMASPSSRPPSVLLSFLRDRPLPSVGSLGACPVPSPLSFSLFSR